MSTPTGPYQPGQYPPPHPAWRPPRPPWRKRHPKAAIGLAVFAGLCVIGGIANATGYGDKPKAKAAATSRARQAASVATDRSYASAKALVAAMGAHGAACTGVVPVSSTITGAVGDIDDCNGATVGDTVVAVFDDHRDAVAYATGIVALADGPDGSPAAVVTGPDWAVNTVPAFSGRVVRAVGGTVVTGSPTPASAAPSSQAPAPAPSPTASVVTTFSGSGIENTPQFTVSGTWKLDYSYWGCAGGSGNFIVDEDGGGDFGGLNVNELGSGGSSSTWAYGDAGTHYLAVDSECSWKMRVIDEP